MVTHVVPNKNLKIEEPAITPSKVPDSNDQTVHLKSPKEYLNSLGGTKFITQNLLSGESK